MMSEADEVPRQIRQSVQKVINLLLLHGLQYESTLAAGPNPPGFLFAKNKYYKYYTGQLFERGPTSRERLQLSRQREKEMVRVQGNLENISVGAMTEIIKNELAQNSREYYQPFDNEHFEEDIELAPKNQNINSKIQELINKYSHLVRRKAANSKEKAKERKDGKQEQIRKDGKQEQIRKQIGAYQDGSLGAYGGKKYEGLGSRDQFDAFRREKSQSYYQSLQEKSK